MCGVFDTKKDSGWQYTRDELFKKIEKQNFEHINYVIVSGGEPTLYDYFFDLIKMLNEKQVKVVIFTNGRKFKDIDFTEKLKNCFYSDILIPLFGSNANIHDYFTQVRGSFDDTVQGLLNLDQAGMAYSIKNVVMNSNYKDLPDWAKFMTKNFKSSKEISIHGLHLQGEAPKAAEKIYVPHNTASPYIQQALDILENSIENISISAIPLCTVDPYYWKYNLAPNILDSIVISEDSKEINNTNLGNYLESPEECSNCSIRNLCVWPWKMYKKLYDLDYLKAY